MRKTVLPELPIFGGCQCGAVRYEVDIAIDEVVACNCSRCGKLGSLLAFTSGDNFRLLTDESALADYQFNTHKIHHLFCPTCGIQSFAKGTPPGGPGRHGDPAAARRAKILGDQQFPGDQALQQLGFLRHRRRPSGRSHRWRRTAERQLSAR